jgi:hypothetical protein
MNNRPAWREPMLWLVAGIPLATLIAGFATLSLAGGSGAIDAAPEPVRRTAQVQQADLAADTAAAHAGLRATLRIDAARRTIVARILPSPSAGDLQLLFVHPSFAAEDRSVTMRLRDGVWVGAMPALPAIEWRLQLSPGDAQWRLVGRWHAGAAAQAEMLPALESR